MQGTEFLIVLGSGAFLLGLATVIWISVTKRRGDGTPNWPSVVGHVTSAVVSELTRETPDGTVSRFTPVVRYDYTVDGEPYHSERLNFLSAKQRTHDDLSSAEQVIADYAAGAAATVFYNPANPKQSALVLPRPAAHNAVLGFGITNVIAGAAIIVLGVVLL